MVKKYTIQDVKDGTAVLYLVKKKDTPRNKFCEDCSVYNNGIKPECDEALKLYSPEIEKPIWRSDIRNACMKRVDGKKRVYKIRKKRAKVAK